MPQSSKDVEASAYLRLLVLGGPKVGKTHTVIATAIPPVYVINSDDKYSLKPAARVCDFTWDLALGTDLDAIEKCIHEARTGVKEGRYNTIVWDTITKYAGRLEDTVAAPTMNAQGEPDGRRYWPRYLKHLRGIIDRLFTLKAHVIVNAHWIESSAVLIEGQTAKSGNGVVPMLGGKARQEIPAEFQDVVFLEKRAGKRIFVASDDGVWGPGCRNLPGVTTCDADIKELWKMMGGKLPASSSKKQR